jgi:hypothetical protein
VENSEGGYRPKIVLKIVSPNIVQPKLLDTSQSDTSRIRVGDWANGDGDAVWFLWNAIFRLYSCVIRNA